MRCRYNSSIRLFWFTSGSTTVSRLRTVSLRIYVRNKEELKEGRSGRTDRQTAGNQTKQQLDSGGDTEKETTALAGQGQVAQQQQQDHAKWMTTFGSREREGGGGLFYVAANPFPFNGLSVEEEEEEAAELWDSSNLHGGIADGVYRRNDLSLCAVDRQRCCWPMPVTATKTETMRKTRLHLMGVGDQLLGNTLRGALSARNDTTAQWRPTAPLYSRALRGVLGETSEVGDPQQLLSQLFQPAISNQRNDGPNDRQFKDCNICAHILTDRDYS